MECTNHYVEKLQLKILTLREKKKSNFFLKIYFQVFSRNFFFRDFLTKIRLGGFNESGSNTNHLGLNLTESNI